MLEKIVGNVIPYYLTHWGSGSTLAFVRQTIVVLYSYAEATAQPIIGMTQGKYLQLTLVQWSLGLLDLFCHP